MKHLTLEDGTAVYALDMLTAQYVYNEIYRDNVYLKHGITVEDGDTVFDIGANIGMFAKYLCEKKRDLKVYTFEPVPAIFSALEKNLSGLKNTPVNINKAIGETEKRENIYFFPKVSADSAIVQVDFDRKINMFVENFDQTIAKMMPVTKLIPKPLRPLMLRLHRKWLYRSKKIPIEVTTTSSIIREYGIEQINLLKIDAENYEWQVLSGIDDEHWKMIDQITMEVHSHIKNGSKMHTDVKNLLESKGFHVFLDTDDPMNTVGIYMLYAQKNRR
ncbi:MAG: FkbM family methyltransferase [Spirochaetia bacterium]